MSDAVLPPPYDQIGHRPFSFYPAVVNVEHNEWRLRRATWSEMLVVNTKSAEEIWIPRRFLGELSRTDEPVMIVGLNKELEFKSGQVLPHVRRVIEMPRAVNDVHRSSPAPEIRTADIVGIRFESSTEKRVGRLIMGALAGGVLACVLIVLFFNSERNPRVSFSPVLQSELGLTGVDDYFAVKRKLGEPAEDHWQSEEGAMQYRVLKYPSQGFSAILMGSERDRALYIGAVDAQGRPVHAVQLPGGRDTSALLRSLKKFYAVPVRFLFLRWNFSHAFRLSGR
jgi:hypothetical protein